MPRSYTPDEVEAMRVALSDNLSDLPAFEDMSGGDLFRSIESVLQTYIIAGVDPADFGFGVAS